MRSIDQARTWLAKQGTGRSNCSYWCPYRAQVTPFAPQMSSTVWRNVMDTSYFGPAFCLREALPLLQQDRGTVFYFNSITSSFALPQAIGYMSVKDARARAILNSVRFDIPVNLRRQLPLQRREHRGLSTTERTMFHDEKATIARASSRPDVAPAVETNPAPVAVAKAIQAIEQSSRTCS